MSNKLDRIEPGRLLLDLENPRFGLSDAKDQQSALRILKNRANLKELWDSISEKGFEDYEPLVAFKQPGGDNYIVVEGNRRLTRRSFGYHLRKSTSINAAEQWIVERKEALTTVLRAIALPPALPWQQELGAKTGASPEFIANLAGAYVTAPILANDASEWLLWLLKQLDPGSPDFDVFLRPETMVRVFGRGYSNQKEGYEQRVVALEGVQALVKPWFSGAPLSDLDKVIVRHIVKHEGRVKVATKPDGKANRGRRFFLRLAPDLSFLCSVFSQVALKVCAAANKAPPPMVGFLPQLVRRGYETPYHYALSKDFGNNSRPQIQSLFTKVSDGLVREASDDWNTVRNKTDSALTSWKFDDIDGDDFEEILREIQAGILNRPPEKSE